MEHDARLPHQAAAPEVAVVSPVVPEPRPAPPEPPPPPPPVDGVEFFARPVWDSPRALEQLCEAATQTVKTIHKELATPPAATEETLRTRLGVLERALDPTLEVMDQIAHLTSPGGDTGPIHAAADACVRSLSALRAELFSSPHIHRAFAAFPDDPRLAGFTASLRRAGAHLPDERRAALATLQAELARLTGALAETARRPLVSVPRSALGGLPAASGVGQDPVPLTLSDLELALAFIPDPTPLAPALEARSAVLDALADLHVSLLLTRLRAAQTLERASWAEYAAAPATPADIERRIAALARTISPAVAREREALGEVQPGRLDLALSTLRGPAADQAFFGPWPHRPVAPATPPAPWWSGVTAPRVPNWSEAEPASPPIAPDVTVPARAIGLMRQVQLAAFALEAHRLPADAISKEGLSRLYTDTLERHGLNTLYPADAWPTFLGLSTQAQYADVVFALVAGITTAAPSGPATSPDDALARWLGTPVESGTATPPPQGETP